MYSVVEGNPSTPSKFVLKAEYIFLMDIGSSGATEYDIDEKIIDLYDNVEGAMEMKMGHIHTHHSMKTFFSTTDMKELEDNVSNHNYYLSLIVNFQGNYSAKVAFISNINTERKMTYMDDNGKLKSFTTKSKEENIVLIDMEIVSDYKDEFFYNTYKNIIKEKEEKERILVKEHKQKQLSFRFGSEYDFYNQHHTVLPIINNNLFIPKKIENISDTNIEKITKLLLNLGHTDDSSDNVYQLLVKISQSSSEELELWEQFFEVSLPEVIDNLSDSNRELSINEKKYLIEEISKSISRYQGLSTLSFLVENINEILTEYIIQEEEVNMI